MRALFAVLLIAAAPVVLPAAPVLAQSTPSPAQTPPAARPGVVDDILQVQIPEPEAGGDADAKAAPGGLESAARAEPDRVKRLDALFAALKAAPDKQSAKSIADRIEVALAPTGSATADLLMGRATMAAEAKNFDLAIQLLDAVVDIEPDHLEAWNKRATVFYLRQDFSDSLADLQQVVAREPRHYGAWAGIAIICKEIGDEKHALEAARKALAIYPHLDSVEDMEETLTLKIEGRPI